MKNRFSMTTRGVGNGPERRTSSQSSFLAFLFATLIKRCSAHDAVNLKVANVAKSTMHQANAVYQPMLLPDK